MVYQFGFPKIGTFFEGAGKKQYGTLGSPMSRASYLTTNQHNNRSRTSRRLCSLTVTVPKHNRSYDIPLTKPLLGQLL